MAEFAKLQSRVGRNSKYAGVGFVVLSIVFLFLSISSQFIVYEVDSVVAFLIAVVLLFRDPRSKVQAVVSDAMQLSSGQTIADLAATADGYAYLPLGGRVEDVVVVPVVSPSPSRLGRNPGSSDVEVTPPGRALAVVFLRESGLTNATMEGLAASLPRMIHEGLGLADSMSITEKEDRVEFTLRGASPVCVPKSDGAGRSSSGVVGCAVSSFFAVLYSSASRRRVVLEDCVHDEAAGTWTIALNLGQAVGGTA
jgi:hypothetical protein